MSIYRYAEDDEKANKSNPKEEGDSDSASEKYQPPETHDESIDVLPKYEPPEIDREQVEPKTSKESKGGEK